MEREKWALEPFVEARSSLVAGNNNEHHVSQVFLELKPVLHRLLRSRGLGVAECEDAIQESFIQIMKTWPRLRVLSKPELRRYAIRVAIGAGENQRRYRKKALLDGPAWNELGRADDRALCEAVSTSREVLRVLTFAEKLSAERREVIRLAAWEGMTPQQIATQLGIPLGTVFSRLARARQAIRALTAASERGPDDFRDAKLRSERSSF